MKDIKAVVALVGLAGFTVWVLVAVALGPRQRDCELANGRWIVDKSGASCWTYDGRRIWPWEHRE